MKFLEDGNFVGKKILVRIDADVPLKAVDGETVVADDFRLRKLLPTLNFLLNRQAKVVLIGHLARPAGTPDPKLSLRPVYLHLSALLKKPILFAPNLFSVATKKTVAELKEKQIVGLENLRFDPGEDNNSRTYAKRLAEYGEVYVNEAFGSHHVAASTVAITEFLPSYAGLHLEQELKTLGSLMKAPAHPFVAVIGGAKIEDKLPVIKGLLENVDRVLVGGRVANNFMVASGIDVQGSTIQADMVEEAKKLLKRSHGKIILPVDFIWEDGHILDLGPKSVELFCHHIRHAKTVLWSGPLGKIEEPRFSRASTAVAKCIIQSGATSIIGGGDTTGFLDSTGIAQKFSFISSGGGATLQLLSGEPLPTIKALEGR